MTWERVLALCNRMYKHALTRHGILRVARKGPVHTQVVKCDVQSCALPPQSGQCRLECVVLVVADSRESSMCATVKSEKVRLQRGVYPGCAVVESLESASCMAMCMLHGIVFVMVVACSPRRVVSNSIRYELHRSISTRGFNTAAPGTPGLRCH